MDVSNANHTLELFEKFKSAIIVSNACELEIFDKLCDNAQSAESLAQKYEWNVDCCRRLLDALVSFQYLVKHSSDGNTVYSNTSRSECLIRSRNPTIWGYTMMMKRMFTNFGNLANEVKTGSHKADAIPQHITVHVPDAAKKDQHHHAEGHGHEGHGHKGHGHKGHGCHGHGDKEMMYARYKTFDGIGSLYASTLATAFDLSAHKSTVDLGGGSGFMSRALAIAYPNMSVTIFEVPPVIELLKEKFLQVVELDNVHLMEGDFLESDLPSADLYVLSKIVHDWRPDQVDFLLNKVHASVNKGGGLILMEKCLTDEKDGPYTAHNWDMLVMAHCGGNLRSGAEYTALLNKHAFTDVKIHKTEPLCSFDVIYARKM